MKIDIDRKTFPSILKKYRGLENLSQSDLAKALKINVKTVSSYENGRCIPSPKRLRKIIKILEIPKEKFSQTNQQEKKHTEEPPKKKSFWARVIGR